MKHAPDINPKTNGYHSAYDGYRNHTNYCITSATAKQPRLYLTAITRLNQVWLSDITYICIGTGFVYLAAILDAYSRKVIDYGVSRSLDTSLTLEALRMAVARRQIGPGVIHHSDQGVQYASGEYVNELKRHGFLISMARTGNPYDNATMESFFKTLKHEEVNLCQCETYRDVLTRLPHFLEMSIITRDFTQLLVTVRQMNSRRYCLIRSKTKRPARLS